MAASGAPSDPDLVAAPRPRILLVEDDRTVARAVTRALTTRGFAVCSIASCTEAQQSLEVFDCGVFDVDLPDGNGIDLALELLASRRVRRAVFFTGSTEPSVHTRAAQVGPVVVKGTEFAELADIVGRSLARRDSGICKKPE